MAEKNSCRDAKKNNFSEQMEFRKKSITRAAWGDSDKTVGNDGVLSFVSNNTSRRTDTGALDYTYETAAHVEDGNSKRLIVLRA